MKGKVAVICLLVMLASAKVGTCWNPATSLANQSKQLNAVELVKQAEAVAQVCSSEIDTLKLMTSWNSQQIANFLGAINLVPMLA